MPTMSLIAGVPRPATAELPSIPIQISVRSSGEQYKFLCTPLCTLPDAVIRGVVLLM